MVRMIMVRMIMAMVGKEEGQDREQEQILGEGSVSKYTASQQMVVITHQGGAQGHVDYSLVL